MSSMSNLILLLFHILSSQAQTYYEPWTKIFQHYSYVDANNLFAIYWNTPTDDDRIEIGITCQSLGYCSFGISSEGLMTDADIIIGWVDNDEFGHLENRYTESSKQEPLYMNNQNNIELIDIFINGTSTYFHFTRELYPCDAESQPIPLGTAKTIYAWSNNKPVVRTDNPNQYTIQYHGNINRGSELINLQTADTIPVDMPSDVETIDIQVTDFQIPSNDTIYYCELFELPPEIFQVEHHAIRIDPIITEGNEGLLHHMTFFYCPTQYVDPDMVGVGELCDQWRNMALNTTECIAGAVIYSWAIGRKEFYLPEHVGIELGGSEVTSVRYIMLNMHYNNPLGVTEISDNSGVTVWYTPTLRENPAGILSAGINSGPNAQFIPPGMKSVKNYGYCLSTCSNNSLSGIPSDGVQIYMANLHAHFKATQIRVRHIRGNEELPYLTWNTDYDFDYRQSVLLDEIATLLPGDKIIVECTYDTTQETKMIYGGDNVYDEMCYVSLGIYPKVDLSWCVTGFGEQKKNEWFNEAQDRGYYDVETDFYDVSMNGALEFYQDLWEGDDTPLMLQNCLNIVSESIGTGFTAIPTGFIVYPEPEFGDCHATKGDDGFVWDWDGWYVLVGLGLIFVITVTTVTYCACTWNDKKYKRFKSIGSAIGSYGATSLTKVPSVEND